MNKFCRNFITHWRKNSLPFTGETFIVAVSGGADSVSLALVLSELQHLKKFNLRFIVAHFNHNLRDDESNLDEIFVEKLAEKLGLEFVSAKGNIGKKGNLEQNARLARYGFFAQVVDKFAAYGVLTAHTINDQAETFLLNLIRGSGVEGLSAMHINSEFQVSGLKFRVIRPFLNWAKRQETEAFCHTANMEFRQDSMNFDKKFTRVRVRNHLIPLMQSFNPRIIETLSNTASLLNSGNITRNFEQIEDELILKNLQIMDKDILNYTLRCWLKHHRRNLRGISSKHIRAIESLIFSQKSGRVAELPNGEQVLKSNGKLTFEKTRVEKTLTDN